MSEKENKKKPTKTKQGITNLNVTRNGQPSENQSQPNSALIQHFPRTTCRLGSAFHGNPSEFTNQGTCESAPKKNIGFATMFLTKASKNADEKEKREWLRNRADHASHDVRKKLSYPMKQKETALTAKEKRSVGKNSEAS